MHVYACKHCTLSLLLARRHGKCVASSRHSQRGVTGSGQLHGKLRARSYGPAVQMMPYIVHTEVTHNTVDCSTRPTLQRRRPAGAAHTLARLTRLTSFDLCIRPLSPSDHVMRDDIIMISLLLT